MKITDDKTLNQLVEMVYKSSKYQNISTELVMRIGKDEIQKRKTLKEAVKETKNKLHQVSEVYIIDQPCYKQWHETIRVACLSEDQSQIQDDCRTIMSHHASSAERLNILDIFYREIFADLPLVHTILDIACGLNPLAIPWMNLLPDTEYLAWDVFTDMIHFLNRTIPLFGIQGKAEVKDVLSIETTPMVDLALILKTLPCLEQVEKKSAIKLLNNVQAPRIIVSFPSTSLGGYSKGMVENYTKTFHGWISNEGWEYKSFEFSSELTFMINKQA